MIVYAQYRNTVSSKKNGVWLDLTIRHPNRDLTSIAKAVGIKPWLIAKKGEVTGPIKWKHSVWTGLVAEGTTARAYERGLQKVYDLTLKHSSLFNEIAADGEIELTINQNVASDDGLVLRLSVYPEFLAALSASQIALRICGWSRTKKDASVGIRLKTKSARRAQASK